LVDVAAELPAGAAAGERGQPTSMPTITVYELTPAAA
jgi:hypothetical protein